MPQRQGRGEQACRLPPGTTGEAVGGLPLSMGHGSTGRAPEAREGGEQACRLPPGTTREAFGGLPLSIGARGLSMGHGSTSRAPLTRVNRARKPMGHVTPGSDRPYSPRCEGGPFWIELRNLYFLAIVAPDLNQRTRALCHGGKRRTSDLQYLERIQPNGSVTTFRSRNVILRREAARMQRAIGNVAEHADAAVFG